MNTKDRFEMIHEQILSEVQAIRELVLDVPMMKYDVANIKTDVAELKDDMKLVKETMREHSLAIQDLQSKSHIHS